MSKDVKKILFFSIIYLIVFFILPMYIILFTNLIADLGWFFIYYFIIFPLTFMLFLVCYRIKFKGTIEFYKKLLLFYWIVFLGLCTFLGFFTYYIINIAFQNFGF